MTREQQIEQDIDREVERRFMERLMAADPLNRLLRQAEREDAILRARAMRPRQHEATRVEVRDGRKG